ncbi:hypothetical protein [Thiovibrio frasassiensis]|uniref:Uncharacterized protein n=1 Tax=Thiovibrio frasassiensis TaxID=2984131 RepID=A0A9X4RLF2_9BACT|nr:hypothetical protein [Thiovibrio frasassiensis]MDG4475644.1 hypothetical protein [Thiovibrio frasassiensis]
MIDPKKSAEDLMNRIFLVLFFLVGLTGCASVQPLNTPSSKPEVTIPNGQKKAVIDKITNMMLGRGYKIKNINEYSAVFGKPLQSTGAAILFGSQFNTTPEGRISYNIVDTTKGVRVIGTLEVVTNPGSGLERVTDLSQNSKNAHEYQQLLEEVAASFEGVK